MSATLPIKRNTRSPDLTFLSVGPNISALFKIPDRFQFEQSAGELASNLAASSSAALRTKLAKDLGPPLKVLESSLTPAEVRSYNNFVDTLRDPTADAAQLRANLEDIRLAALAAVPGVAIVLMDAEAETRIEDNQITGVVSLYGLPGSKTLTGAELNRLFDLRFAKITFSDSLATLQIRNNVIFRMDVSEKTFAMLKALSPGGTTSLKRLYRRCFITDNDFGSGDNNLVMEHLALTSNSFEGQKRVAIVIAKAATYVGNYAGDPKRVLFNAAQDSEKAANLAITIAGP